MDSLLTIFLNLSKRSKFLKTGMPMESHRKCRTAFCGKPVYVAHIQCPKTEGPKVVRERNVSL